METLSLVAVKRETEDKKANAYRKEGILPAVLYGGKNKESISVRVDEKEFAKIFRKAGESSLVSLDLGDKTARKVLIHGIEKHPVTGRFMHVDFFEVRMDEKLKTTVPLRFIGESLAVKQEGGNLVKTLQELEIECLPQDLPHDLTVDISALVKFHDSMRIRDIKLPAGVTTKMDSDEVIVLVEAPRSEEEISKLAESVDDQAAIAGIKTEAEEKKEKAGTSEDEKAE
jgi:large subunit ribosomal protein L25